MNRRQIILAALLCAAGNRPRKPRLPFCMARAQQIRARIALSL